MFRSYTVTTNPGPDCAIWQALYATMAHPDLFKSIDIVESSVPQSFVGGELGCSNPLAHVLTEVERLYPGRQVASVISIGTGHTRTIQVPSSSRWHRTQDVIVMKDMATDSERVAEEMMIRFQGTNGVYFRFNVDQGMQNVRDGSWERVGETMQHTKAYLQKSETNQKIEEAVRASIARRGTVSTALVAGQIVSSVFEATKRLVGFKRCPAPTKFYTGRQNENAQVILCLTGGKDELRVCVVYGLGGVGKTQLALKVIEQTWDEWDYIIYVDASSQYAIEKALTDFGAAKSIGNAYADVVGWLESFGERWLVVFDNADTASINVRQYIPTRGRGGSVIITTRLPDLARLAEGPGSVCHLSSMSQTDGAALLVKITSLGNQCPPDDDTQVAGQLVQDFGCLALAIVHAGAYIAHSPGMSITKYRSLLLSQRRRMLEGYNKLPPPAKLDERGDTVYTTWRMCYDQLQPESRELLWLISYLHYDGISEEIFQRAAQNIHSKKYPLPRTELESQAWDYVQQYLSTFLGSDGNWDTVKFTEVMADLTTFSLIDFDRMNLTYRVHVLVHDWAKTTVPHAPDLAIDCTTTLLSLSIDWKTDAKSLAFKRQLGLHVTSVLTHNPNLGLNHSHYLHLVYQCTGQWIRTTSLLQPLLDVFQRELGMNDVKTWLILSNLGQIKSTSGQRDEGLHLQTQVNAHKQPPREEHPEILRAMNSLAWAYFNLGQYNKAEQLGAEVVNACKQILGEEHPDTLHSINSLALTYLHLGRQDEAKQLQIMLLNARQRLLGDKHPDTLASMGNLAMTYLKLGQYDKGKQLHIQTLDARKQVLGEDHPDTLTSTNNLALIYTNMGQLGEAEKLNLLVLKTRQQILGEEHPDTLISMGNLAATYSYRGQHDKAKQLEVQVLNSRKRVLGEDHPDTLILMNNLAWTYSDLGQWDESEELYHKAINIAVKALGDQHPHTQTFRRNLARMQSKRQAEM
ncbi:hypothetical protein ACGC1H_007280 [Rhizoctonia solani]